jgi:RNA polymerase sigma-70 factor (ECF subfamily)
MDDNALIDRFLQGEKSCFDELVLKYKNMVFTVCLRMLGDYEEALDTSQDVFLKIYTSLADFRRESKFSTYLYRVVMNFCKNKLKVMARTSRKRCFSLDEPVRREEGELKRQIPSTGPTPREVLENKEKQEKIMAGLQVLKQEYREIIVLREIRDLSYEEIALVLNIDIGTVKSRLNRARLAFRDILKEMV